MNKVHKQFFKKGEEMNIYDEMMEIYRDNPDMFEERRGELLEEFIARAHPEHQLKLRQLQWEIDGILIRSKNDLERFQNFQTFFMEKIYGDNGYLQEILKIIGNANLEIDKKQDEKKMKFKVIK